MPAEDPIEPSSSAATHDERGEPPLDRAAVGRRPNAFGCLLLLTGVLFAILTVLGLRAYARISMFDIWSLAMIAFVGILAIGQIIVGVWMLRGARSDSEIP